MLNLLLVFTFPSAALCPVAAPSDVNLTAGDDAGGAVLAAAAADDSRVVATGAGLPDRTPPLPVTVDRVGAAAGAAGGMGIGTTFGPGS